MSAWYDEAVSADLSGYAAGSLEQAETRPAFIEIDLKNAFNSHSRQAAFDTLAGKATKDYVGAGVLSGEALPHLAELQKFFPYFCNMYDSAATLRFYDSTGQVHHIPGTTGSQQGDSAAMLNFSHVTHPLWGGIMGQYPSARAAAYADDGFVRDTLLTVLRILAALKHAFKEDLGMELTLPKCKVLIPGLSQEDANDAIRSVISSHAELSSLQDMVLSCLSTSDGVMAFTEGEWQNWFCSFLGPCTQVIGRPNPLSSARSGAPTCLAPSFMVPRLQ